MYIQKAVTVSLSLFVPIYQVVGIKKAIALNFCLKKAAEHVCAMAKVTPCLKSGVVPLPKWDIVLNHNHCRPSKWNRGGRQHVSVSQPWREYNPQYNAWSCAQHLMLSSSRLQCTTAYSGINTAELKSLSKPRSTYIREVRQQHRFSQVCSLNWWLDYVTKWCIYCKTCVFTCTY